VIEYVAYNINVITSERLQDCSLSLATAKSGTVNVYEKAAVTIVMSPLLKIGINLRYEILASTHTDYAKFAE
jgi:hypothetical protein